MPTHSTPTVVPLLLACAGLAAAAPAAPTGRDPNPVRPPYISEVYLYDLGGHGLGPELTMWEQTNRGDAAWAKGNRRQVQDALARGLRPIHGLVRWGTEYKEGLPGGKLADKPPYRAWAEWHRQHEALFVRTANGEVFHPDWGVISPAMPLDEKDWPPGVKDATYGDWLAARLAGLYEQTGLVGSFAADFYDCLPHFDCGSGDFHPRVVDAFAKWAKAAVPPGPVPERAAFIKKNLMHAWISFFSDAYGRFWGGVAKAVKQKTGHPGFVSMQGTYNAYTNRWIGRDVRLLEKYIVREAGGRGLRIVELQGDDGRPLFGVSLGYGFMLDFACQAPDLWVGTQMNCPDHEAFRASLDRTWKGDAGAKEEFAKKYIKGHWLTVAWAHTADRDGAVRRAAQVFHRQYWDAGHVPEDVERVMLGTCPTRPFGPAFYFSMPVAYALEGQGRQINVESLKSAVVDKGVAAGYAVSDATIDAIRGRPESRPTAFLTPCLHLMPPEERAKLEAVAPVLDLEEAARKPETVPSPVRFSPDVCGYAFFDQDARLVVLAWRPSGGYGADVAKLGAADVTAAVTLSGIPDGKYAAADLFDPKTTVPLVVAGRTGSFSFPMSRWDVRAFRTDVTAPRRNGGNGRAAATAAAAPAPATESKPAERKAASPEAAAAWDAKLRARVGEETAAGRKPSFTLAALGQPVRVAAIDATGTLTLQGGGSALAWKWPDLAAADRKGLAAALAEPGAPADLALAAFFALAAGDERAAEGYLKRLPEGEADAVRGAFR